MADNFQTNMNNPIIDLDNVFPEDIIEKEECPACLSKVGHKCLTCQTKEDKEKAENLAGMQATDDDMDDDSGDRNLNDNGNLPPGYSDRDL